MTLPFEARTQFNMQEALLRSELNTLTNEVSDMNKYRSYFEGEQELVYSTDLFKQIFGNAFEGFSDNWVKVVVNVVRDRLKLVSFNFEDDDDFVLADEIWRVFRLNNINTQQRDLHEGTLVEGRAFVIVWPDEELGATIDWQPGQICRVFYDPDRRTRPLWAIRRWVTESGDTYITFYTPEFVYKYIDNNTTATGSNAVTNASSTSALTEIPGVGSFGNLEQRIIEGESWPLPNPFKRVPVVEFNNTSYTSAIKDTIPQQDALNKTLLDMLVTGEFQAFPQRVVETMASAPAGGWTAGAGEVWHFTPSVDADGKHIPSQFTNFDVADPSTYMEPIQMWLEHMALTSSTPVRYFTQSDRGGRGDSPSGESLLVDDKSLNDKVEAIQDLNGNSWINVAQLVALALGKSESATLIGDAVWQGPEHDYRMTRLKEGVEMAKMKIPLQFIVTQLGFRPSEVTMLLEMIEERDAEIQAAEDEARVLREENEQSALAVSNPQSDAGTSDNT